MGILRQIVFREPDGRQKGFIFLLLSAICLITWVYTGVVLDTSHFFLFIGIALGFSGFAESLSPDRQRSAGVLRIAAVGTLLVYLSLLASVPELLL